jgi:Transglycosylase SLT domain
MKIKYFVYIALMLICCISIADPLDKFVNTVDEQDNAIEWVKEITKDRVDNVQLRTIVSTAYAHAVSKDINPRLVLAIMRTESSFNASAKSNHGAKGLMQVMPRWHKDKLAGRSPYLIKVSTEVGTRILQDCLDKHRGNVYRGLNCYSGGGGKKYFDKVAKYQLELSRSMLPKGTLVAVR